MIPLRHSSRPTGLLSGAARRVLTLAGVLVVLALLGECHPARGQLQALVSPRRTNRRIEGEVLEFTRQHGPTRGIESRVLGQRRDVYVYIPPNYDRQRSYPLAIWLHGGFGDEHAFLELGQIEWLDDMICRGCCPPMVVVAPDITCNGRNCLTSKHSFGVNGCCGRFEDYLICELVPWVRRNFRVCCDPRHNAVVGLSAGGMAAMKLALKHRDQFGVAASVAGALNLRYCTRQGDCFADFDPATFCMQTTWDRNQVIGQLGVFKLRAKSVYEPVFGVEPGVICRIIRENPADLVCSTQLNPGELRMLVAFGCQDELNFDAHGSSFAWLCRRRGVDVDLDVDPEGRHNEDYFKAAQRRAWTWIARQLEDLVQACP